MVTNPACGLCRPSDPEHPLFIAHTRHFKVALMGADQKLPGRLVIATRAHFPRLAEWPEEHWIEFGRLEGALERALRESLDPDEPRKFVNAQCNMNRAGDEGAHTHWHILPRYRNPITLTDPESGELLTFKDEDFGQPYKFDYSTVPDVSEALMTEIIGAIQAKLDLTGITEGAVGR